MKIKQKIKLFYDDNNYIIWFIFLLIVHGLTMYFLSLIFRLITFSFLIYYVVNFILKS